MAVAHLLDNYCSFRETKFMRSEVTANYLKIVLVKGNLFFAKVFLDQDRFI